MTVVRSRAVTQRVVDERVDEGLEVGRQRRDLAGDAALDDDAAARDARPAPLDAVEQVVDVRAGVGGRRQVELLEPHELAGDALDAVELLEHDAAGVLDLGRRRVRAAAQELDVAARDLDRRRELVRGVGDLAALALEQLGALGRERGRRGERALAASTCQTIAAKITTANGIS